LNRNISIQVKTKLNHGQKIVAIILTQDYDQYIINTLKVISNIIRSKNSNQYHFYKKGRKKWQHCKKKKRVIYQIILTNNITLIYY
jgi:frataxin-like iron-binding protein CyaY